MRKNVVIWTGALFLFSLLSCTESKPQDASQTPAFANKEQKPTIRFTDITKKAGIDIKHESGAYGEFFMPESMGGGAAFLDYNGDNFQDLLLIGGWAWDKSKVQNVPSLRLYKNKGNGTFDETTQQAGLDKIKAYAFGATVGDYDNDGDDDVYVTTLTKNILLKNDGGRFTDVAKTAGVQGADVWSTASIFVDVDLDGNLDLYVGNYVKWSKEIDRSLWCSLDGKSDNYCNPDLFDGERGVFYHNNGDGTFSDETKLRGFSVINHLAPIKTLGIALIDADHNGWPDLVLANDMQADLLFLNLGNGTFKETGTQAGIAYSRLGKPQAGMGVAVGELDNRGNESIIVGNFSQQPISVYKSLNNGLFVDNSYTSKIGEPSFLTLTFGLTLFDADLDGDLDLFAANGHIFTDIQKIAGNITYRQIPHFFVNDGEGIFSDEARKIGGVIGDSLVARASAYADIDLDGDLDLLVTENNGPVHLLRNDTEPKLHFFRILLRANGGNTNAIGALATISYAGKKQRRTVTSSQGYLSQPEFPLTFGLGQNDKIDSLVVNWPGEGTSVFKNPAIDKFLIIEKGNDAVRVANIK